MKKPITIIYLLLTAIVCCAQDNWSETIYGCYEDSLDLQKVSQWNENIQRRAMPLFDQAQGDVNVRWIDRIKNMPSHLCDFYQTYGNLIHSALKGENNCLTDPTLGELIAYANCYYMPIKTYEGTIPFSFPKDASTEIIREYATKATQDVVNEFWNTDNTFIPYLIICLGYDYPEGFWLNSYYQWNNYFSYRYNYSQSSGTGTITYNMQVTFKLKDNDFHHFRDEFQNTDVLASAIQEYNTCVSQLTTATVNQGNRYNQVVYLNDWLTTHNSYNSAYGKEDYVAQIAWSPLSALRGTTGAKGPVCEAYARAFKVICDQLDIPCVLAVGYARSSRSANGEDHMWNEMKMDDGKWYAVDVTWNDPYDDQNRQVSGMEYRKWLLLGSEDIVAPNMTFAESHPFTLTWGANSQKSDQWDYTIQSFITDHKYDPESVVTGITQPNIQAPAAIYGINGQRLGNNATGSGSPKIVIVNGKKVIKSPSGLF